MPLYRWWRRRRWRWRSTCRPSIGCGRGLLTRPHGHIRWHAHLREIVHLLTIHHRLIGHTLRRVLVRMVGMMMLLHVQRIRIGLLWRRRLILNSRHVHNLSPVYHFFDDSIRALTDLTLGLIMTGRIGPVFIAVVCVTTGRVIIAIVILPI